MTTYYVDGAVGNDANAGTSEGAGNAWATIDKAMNTVAAGDTVYVKASATYNETATIDTVGTTAAPIIFEGYTTTTGDNGKVTMNGGGTTASGIAATLPSYYVFKNFIITNFSSHGVSAVNGDNITWFNCEFTSNGADGALVDNDNIFVQCTIANNTSEGVTGGTTCGFVGCLIYGNGDEQVAISTPSMFYKNVVYAHTGIADAVNLGGAAVTIAQNTFDADGATGIVVDCTSADILFVDNIVYDGGTGLNNTGNGFIPGQGFYGYNLMNSNTTDYANTGYLVGVSDVTSAPSFSNEAGDDYTLADDSPAINAGMTPGGIT